MRKENLNQNEQGRSMVEMLGVLAIIGVLSVMGIAGYRSAMTRHRANELLNEASKRAVVVSAQLSLQGLATANLNEFTEYQFSGGEFSRDAITPTDGQFQIQINAVDESVCEQMKGTAEENAIIQKFEPGTCSGSDNTVLLTYNNTLSPEAATPAQAPCPDGISRAWDGSCSVCDNGKVYLPYNNNTCELEVSGNCTSNNDCVTGEEYCNLTSSTCEYPTSGTCELIPEGEPANIASFGTVVKSPSELSWWAAENWCRAQGMRLVTVEEIQCYVAGTNNPIEEKSGAYRYCCKGENQVCADWDRRWNGKVPNNSDYVTTRYSPIIIALRQAYNQTYLWTASDYSTTNSCYVFLVGLVYGDVFQAPRTDAYEHYALCVEN